MRLLIIRHADPDYPNNTITAAGHKEAAALARRLARQGVDRLYSSPLGRAVDTLRYTADATGLPFNIEPWTAELGHWRIEIDGLGKACVWDLHGHAIRALPRPLTHDNWHTQPPLDNPLFRREFEELIAQSDRFLARHGYVREGHAYRVEHPSREKIAVFCHGGFGLTWLAHLLDIPLPMVWAGFFLPPSSVTTLLFDERRRHVATPRCVGLGDVSHLYADDVPVSNSGIKANVD